MLIRNYQDLFSFFREMAVKPAALHASAAGVYLPEGRHLVVQRINSAGGCVQNFFGL
jgi:hypothetical protein